MRTPEEWISLYLEGRIPAGEESAFNAWLQSDPDHLELLAQQLDLHGSLKSQLQKAPAGTTGRIRMVRKSRLTRPRVAWSELGAWVWAAAALLAILASVPFLRHRDPPSRPAPEPVTRRELPRPEPEEAPAPPTPEPPPQPDPLPKSDPLPKIEEAPKVPPPAPKPDPVVPAPAPPKLERTVVSVADLRDLRGDILVDKMPTKAAQGLAVGQAVEAIGRESSAAIVFPDGTRVDLQGDTEVRDLGVEKGKRLFLARGGLEARVAKQDRAMIFETPQAEAKVLGTTLRLRVAESTLLEVDEGKVRLTRIADQKSVDVSAGSSATSSELKAKPLAKPSVLLSFDFEDTASPLVQVGKLVPGPKRTGNRGCLAGEEIPADRLIRVLFAEDRNGLFAVRDGAALSFDYWVAEKVQAVDVYVWDNTRKASIGGPSLLSLTKEKWTRVTIPLSDFATKNGQRLQDGDVLTQLTIQTGGANGGGPLFVDNVDVTVVRKK
ncbi:MAG: FecR domain-containing protein [Planctomycetaceae bacterium]|nr:FecR domain-containing protein [Planctomycetaceae bacterium]